MRGKDVKCLQALLNRDPETQIAKSGIGSPGKETEYFGPATQRALKKFQKKYKTGFLGIVGPKTRAALNSLLRE